MNVPEHEVKRLLAELGTRVPGGVTLPASATAADFLDPLAQFVGPGVLKAWGPGIVHKTEVGAVSVGVHVESLGPALERMRESLASHGLQVDGFLLEELVPAGVELLVGAVDAPGFGPVIALGLGGTAVEVLDEVVTRLCPLTRDDAVAMVRSFRGARLLEAHRGRPAADVESLVDVLLAVDALVAKLGPAFAELECNPVFVNEHGATAADARLILHDDVPTSGLPKPFGLEGLFAPRSVAVAGASTSKTTVANRTLRNYRARGWTEHLYAIHPTATEIDGVPAYPSVAQVPEPVDYLALMVPAAACPEIVRSAKGRVRYVHVLSSGFGETGTEGARLQDDLLAAVRNSAVRLVGPNSLGVFSVTSGQTWGAGLPRAAGRVGGAFQSGGVSTSVLPLGPAYGVHFGKAVSTGNGTDITVGEVAGYLLDDPETDVIALYVEGGVDAQLIDVCRGARGRKPVVVLAPGLTDAGAQAAASHTGALTGGRRAWSAVQASTGAVVTETVEDFLAVLGQVVAHRELATGDPAVLIVGNGGGASVMAVDACDSAGLNMSPCAAAADALRELGLPSGTSLVNPVDVPIFQGTAPELLANVVRTALAAQAYSDVLMHIDVAPYYALGDYREDLPGSTHLLTVADALSGLVGGPARLCVVARNLDCAPAADAEAIRAAFRTAGVPLHRTFGEAARAIAAVQHLHNAKGSR